MDDAVLPAQRIGLEKEWQVEQKNGDAHSQNADIVINALQALRWVEESKKILCDRSGNLRAINDNCQGEQRAVAITRRV